MSDTEDYLSDKFLSQTAEPSNSLTYGERRRQAKRESELKNKQNRRKSRRELEEESRREGLSKSLFERAREEEQGNKAIAMMMKMGFKPGQSLGRIEQPAPAPAAEADLGTDPDVIEQSESSGTKTLGHLVEPLPLDVWSGRLGVGKRKRAASPVAAEKLAKVVKQAEEAAHGSFRERARHEYEERRAEGRLASATRTCITLDEKADKNFNTLWLDPHDPDSFPSELFDALTSEGVATDVLDTTTESDRIRRQMRADALQPLADNAEDEDNDATSSVALSGVKSQIEDEERYPLHVVNEARVFIRLSADVRLERVLTYLRDEYFYCFWCGTQYTSSQDLEESCPGPDEESHD